MARLSSANQVDEFNKALAAYKQKFLAYVTPTLEDTALFGLIKIDKASFEAFFNHFAPFYLCSMLYVIIIGLAVVSWLTWRVPLLRAAFALGVLTFLLHTFALLSRMYLQGRPPVTNLYSSAVFIGWGCLLVCLVLEWIYWKGIGIVVGGILGALTMMIAHLLSEGGDTMEMLQAVLDTNFLAGDACYLCHVRLHGDVCGRLHCQAVLYVLLGVSFTQKIDNETNKTYGGKMPLWRALFCHLPELHGTVLGGIWADYSWGRFWGWDAKENGAVMVVIWNTLILHARWAGLVKLRGMAVLAIASNMVGLLAGRGSARTMLEAKAGLHSYGFSTELAERCMWSWIVLSLSHPSRLLLPVRYWRSFKRGDDSRTRRSSKT